MKYFFIVLALIAAVVLALMYVPVKDGRPLVEPGRVQTTVEQVLGATSGHTLDGKDAWLEPAYEEVLYRWQDGDGRWQYGDRPPPGVAAEPVEKKSVETISAGAVIPSFDGAEQQK